MSYIGRVPQDIVMTEGDDTPLVVGQCLHTAGVTGSIPVAPTIKSPGLKPGFLYGRDEYNS